MELKQITIWVACVLAGLIVSGCGEVLNFYPGPELPADQVATLRCKGYISSIKIDGETVKWKNGRTGASWPTIRMLPGLHEIEWSVFPCNANYSANFFISQSGSLDAKPGGTYHLKYRLLIDRKDNISLFLQQPGEYGIMDSATWIEKSKVVLVGEKPEWVKD